LTHRRPLRLVLIADLRDHPHRPLTQLRRIPPRGIPCHDSILPNKWSLRTSRGGSYRGRRPTSIEDLSADANAKSGRAQGLRSARAATSFLAIPHIFVIMT